MQQSEIRTSWAASSPRLLSVLRIVAAFIFIQEGAAKLFAFPTPLMPGGSAFPLFSRLGIAGGLEFIGGVLMLVGLWTRPVAFLLAGEMAIAYFTAHAPNSFWIVANQGMAAVIFCFVWLYFSAAGGGPWSLDAAISKMRIKRWFNLWSMQPSHSGEPALQQR